MDSESKITVSRTSPDDVKQRQVILMLDGEPFATLMYGKTVTKIVAAGHHTLRADNTWNKKTIEFDLAPGEYVRFHAVNRAGRFTWWMVAALGAGPMYVSLERAD